MASITKTDKGYRALVAVKGQRPSKTFRTKREAEAWAAAKETELRTNAAKSPGELHTLQQALERYQREVTPTKKSRRQEELRIARMINDGLLPMHKPLGSVTSDDLGKWRDARLKSVTPGAVLREISIISHLFSVAKSEWKWIATSPMEDTRRPPAPPHRTAIYTKLHIKAILKETGYSPSKPVRSVAQATAVAWLLACRTGMRQGEICALQWGRDVFKDHCHVNSKTPAGDRDVPLETKALRLIEKMRHYDPKLVFGFASGETLSSNFKKYRIRAGVEGVDFHDSRHYAATNLAPRMDILTMCVMFGWSNPKEAMVYFQPKASSVAKMLSAQSRSR